jgi:predicted Zn finger-like uncharacterized protein
MNRMRIACPSCGAEYDVPDRLLAGAARTLRCSRCGTDFALQQVAQAAEVVPPAPPPAPEPPVAAAPAPPTPDPPPTAPTPRERTPVASTPPNDAALQRAWVASLLVVVGGVLGLLVFRSQVMAAWPPATRLFAVLGLG